MLWLIAAFILTVLLFWFGLKQPQYLQKSLTIITQYQLFFTVSRWLFIIAGFACWPHLIRRLSRHRHWQEEKTLLWLKQRFRVFIWLALFELIVCENIFLHLLRILEGRV